MPSDLIDVHTHVVPQRLPPYLGDDVRAAWPSMAPAQACHQHVMVQGKVFRTVSHQCWDCGVRGEEMDRLHVGRQVLSPMPELLSTWLAPADGVALCQYLNETVAEMVATAPARFVGLGAVPLQDTDAAIAMLDVAVHELGLAGVEIPGHAAGVVIGDARLRPFFEAAARWGAAIFVHPLRPAGTERLVGPPALEQVLAFPGDTGLAAASMITGGTLGQLPDLRIALSHGGGTLQALLPRLNHAWQILPALREECMEAPGTLARRLYVDNLVYDAATIHRLIDVFGIDRVMVGTDYPFAIMDADPEARLHSLNLAPELLAKLRTDNARRWLALDPAGSAP